MESFYEGVHCCDKLVVFFKASSGFYRGGGYALTRRYNLEGFSKELTLMSSFGGAARAVKP
jgi:hypothetical protein